MRKSLICVAAALIAMSCANQETAVVPGIDVKDLDPSVAPGTDFYAYAKVWVQNIPTFFEAFGIKEGDAMFRPESERTVIW